MDPTPDSDTMPAPLPSASRASVWPHKHSATDYSLRCRTVEALTRYEKRAVNFRAMAVIASLMLWLPS
jgi:hypothetical protein